MDTCRIGPWPERLIEAIAYHEAGHAVMAVHLGTPLEYVWIADGRPCDAGEEAIQGMTGSRLPVTNPLQMVFQGSFQGVGPQYSETLAPRYDKFDTLHVEYPDFQPWPFENGLINDLRRSAEGLGQLYSFFGIRDRSAMVAAFVQFTLEPAWAVMRRYRETTVRFAEHLRKHHYVDGQEAQTLICGGDGPPLPGCMQRSLGDKFHRRRAAIESLLNTEPARS